LARAIAATTSIALFTSLPFLFHEFCKQSWWVSTLPKLSSHVARLRLNARGDDVGLVLKLDGLEPDVQGVSDQAAAFLGQSTKNPKKCQSFFLNWK